MRLWEGPEGEGTSENKLCHVYDDKVMTKIPELTPWAYKCSCQYSNNNNNTQEAALAILPLTTCPV